MSQTHLYFYHLPVTMPCNSFRNSRSTIKMPDFMLELMYVNIFHVILKYKPVIIQGKTFRSIYTHHLHLNILVKLNFSQSSGWWIPNCILVIAFVNVIWWWKMVESKRKNLTNSYILLRKRKIVFHVWLPFCIWFSPI